MPQRIACRFIVSSQDIDIEHILPRAPTHGARLNLAQTDIPQCKNAEGFEQCSRNVFHTKRERGFVRSRNYAPSLTDVKEAGEIAFVVFNPSLHDVSTVHARSLLARDPCRIP